MPLDYVGRAVLDVDAATVALPPGNRRREPLVSVDDPAVELLLESILEAPGLRIAALPKLLNEAVTLLIGGEPFENGTLFVRDDVNDLSVQPVVGRVYDPDAPFMLLLSAAHAPVAPGGKRGSSMKKPHED